MAHSIDEFDTALINTVVDDFFSFIYNEESTSDDDDDSGACGNIIDEHFSFLKDENLPDEDFIEEINENETIGPPDVTEQTSDQINSQVLDIYVPGDSTYTENPSIINITVVPDDTDANTDVNTDANNFVNTNANTDVNTDANIDANTFVNTYANTYANTDVNTDINRERKSSVYLNADNSDFDFMSTQFTISFPSDLDAPDIYLLNTQQNSGIADTITDNGCVVSDNDNLTETNKSELIHTIEDEIQENGDCTVEKMDTDQKSLDNIIPGESDMERLRQFDIDILNIESQYPDISDIQVVPDVPRDTRIPPDNGIEDILPDEVPEIVEAFNTDVLSSNRQVVLTLSPAEEEVTPDEGDLNHTTIQYSRTPDGVTPDEGDLNHTTTQYTRTPDGVTPDEGDVRHTTIQYTTEDPLTTFPEGSTEQLCQNDYDAEGGSKGRVVGPPDEGVTAAMSRAIRRSLRRLKHSRLSGRRSRRREIRNHVSPSASEETEVRRQVPADPEVGLSSVRSPTTSALLIESLLAGLSPSDIPREILPRIPTASEFTPTRTDRQDSRVVSPEPGPQNGTSTPTASQEINSSSSRLNRPPSLDPEPGAWFTPITATPVAVHTRESRSVGGTRNGISSQNRDRRTRRINSANSANRTNNSANISVNGDSNNNSADNNNGRRQSQFTRRSSSQRTTSSNQTQENVASVASPLRTRDNGARTRSSSQGFLPPKRGVWPHSHSGLMASMAVTVTMFNISRFAVFGAQYGWQFPIQWLIISLVLGLPLMAFHAALGQYIGGTIIDMWVISPLFQGVGFSLLLAEVVLGVYCCVPVAWLFTYFRDSFDPQQFKCFQSLDCDNAQNLTANINHIVPRFFASTVPQRSVDAPVLSALASVKFDLTFNIALLWIITFLALSRGARSYGRISYLIFLMPLICYLAVCGNVIYWLVKAIDLSHLKVHFDFNPHSWMAAGRESFLVWAVHGAVIQQAAANNKRRHRLWKDTTALAFVTVLCLSLASFCGVLCSAFLKEKQVIYQASSFETEASRMFIDVHVSQKDPTEIYNERETILSPRYYLDSLAHDNFYVGIRIRNRFKSNQTHSGYNVIRFVTELFPAVVFAKEDESLMPLWPPLFYAALLLFGIAQQLSVWQFVVQAVIRMNFERLRSWETFITFCCCLFGFSASLTMTTGLGIHILFFLDYLIGCAWWIMILQLIQIFAVLFVRGKPCSAHEIAKRLLDQGRCCSSSGPLDQGRCCSFLWLSTPLSFAWTIMVPVGLLVLSISSFKTGNYREIFAWDWDYWPVWTSQLASGLQLAPLLIVPVVGLIQTCRYLSDPRQDLFQRLQHLYRPPQCDDEELSRRAEQEEGEEGALHLPYSGANPPPIDEGDAGVQQEPRPYSDPPPKYTPPPSYSTATGSTFSKFINQSMGGGRRFLHLNRQTSSAPSEERNRSPPTRRQRPYIPPPDYLPASHRTPTNQNTQSHRTPTNTQNTTSHRNSTNTQNHTPSSQRSHTSNAQVSQTSPTNAQLSHTSSTNTQLSHTSSTTEIPDPPQYATLDPLRRKRQNLALGKEGLMGLSPDALLGEYSRSFSRATSFRRSGDLRRSLTNSLRRSARRLAATFSGSTISHISGNGQDLVSSAAYSNLELASQSEA